MEEKEYMEKSMMEIWLISRIYQQLEYRMPMEVAELKVYPNLFRGSAYYICPRCRVTMEREFQSYCDRCGQKLDWRKYLKVKII